MLPTAANWQVAVQHETVGFPLNGPSSHCSPGSTTPSPHAAPAAGWYVAVRRTRQRIPTKGAGEFRISHLLDSRVQDIENRARHW